MKTVKPKTILD